MFRLACAAIAALLVAAASAARAEPQLRVAWLGFAAAPERAVAFIDGTMPEDEGLAGLRLAIADNNAAGRFLKQSFALEAVSLPPGGDASAALARLADSGIRFVAVDLPAPVLVKLANEPKAAGLTIFNAGAADDSLRNQDCRANVLHTLPSRAMLADALGQYLMRKNWRKWLLVVGPDPADEAYGAAIQRAAAKFGAKVVAEKRWTYTRDSQRSAEGEVAAMTQGIAYDLVVVADEAGNFGDEFPYNTWDPRPVAGTHGLVATGWHAAHDQWGAAQVQNRFRDAAGRAMTAKDFAAWEAGRAIGEAAMRGRSTEPGTIAALMRRDDFALAAFKGRGLSFRSWDGQLRQPILLAWARAVVAAAPIEGFLHPVTDLDTLGTDKGESRCALR